MGISTCNIVCFVVAICFLAFHTFLFIDLSYKQQASLRRIDDLERLLKNATTKNSIEKAITSNYLQELQMRLDSEFTNADDNVKVLRLLRKVQRLEKRVEKCIVHSLRKKRYRAEYGSHLNANGNNIWAGPTVTYIVHSLRKKRYREYRRPRRSYNSNKKTKKYAVFTIWGVVRCSSQSVLVHTGQMVTTDGSDYLCLSDIPDDIPPRKTKTPLRNLGSSVSLRGVTYGDVEDVIDFTHTDKPPPSGPKSRNNKTVPCVVCARQNKSGSKMMSSSIDIKKIKTFNMQYEYVGVLMASKESKKLICLSIDAQVYTVRKNKNMTSNPVLADTVQIHPVELRCNSMYCEAGDQKNKYYNNVDHFYKEGYRIKCMVVTF